MIWFLDSSILVKRYVREADSAQVAQLFRARRRFAASTLASLEIRSALFRRVNEGQLDEARAIAAARDVDDDLRAMLLVEPRARTLKLAAELIERHRLRAYDALQLSSALALTATAGRSVTFGCADAGLRAAAVAEGLRLFPTA